MAIPTAHGYHVKLPDIDPKNRSPNAYLKNNKGERLHLWVSDLMTSFKMGGATAQSILKRQFFPRNFIQPEITIKGQMPNSHQYNRLGEFVRDTQVDALFSSDPLTEFVLFQGGLPAGRNLKGRHKSWRIQGYIPTIPRGAERFVNAPEFEFNFICSISQTGLYEDTRIRAAAQKLLTWTQIFENTKGKGYITDPDKQQSIPTADDEGDGSIDAPTPTPPAFDPTTFDPFPTP